MDQNKNKRKKFYLFFYEQISWVFCPEGLCPNADCSNNEFCSVTEDFGFTEIELILNDSPNNRLKNFETKRKLRKQECTGAHQIICIIRWLK